jgi:hypothetical protein
MCIYKSPHTWYTRTNTITQTRTNTFKTRTHAHIDIRIRIHPHTHTRPQTHTQTQAQTHTLGGYDGDRADVVGVVTEGLEVLAHAPPRAWGEEDYNALTVQQH